MTISVVIPAYNVGEHIGRTIDSVVGQSRVADEIIVVDDGSTDNTAEQIQRYGEQVKYIHQKNSGASVARNRGIEEADSEWIALLDGDDEWLKDYLEKQISLLERNPELVWCGANFINCYCKEDKRSDKLTVEQGVSLLNGREYFDDYFQAFISGATGWTGTMIIKRSVLIEAGMFTPGQPMANDLDMWWKIAHLHPKIGYNAEPLAIYHCNVANSITKLHRDPQILSDLITKHLDIATSQGSFDRFRPCAAQMIRYWVHKYLADDRIDKIRSVAKDHKNILPLGYRTAINLLTISPKLTTFLMPVLKNINKIFRLNV